jgi:hypothetical protein
MAEMVNAANYVRYAIKLQDNETGIVMAVGSNDISAFQKTDLNEFFRTFKRRVKEAERKQRQASKEGKEV